jgi:hypothetical protein
VFGLYIYTVLVWFLQDSIQIFIYIFFRYWFPYMLIVKSSDRSAVSIL